MQFDIGGFSGGVISQKGGSPIRVVSATIFLDPGQDNNAPSNSSGPFGLFNYYGTHEIGHTFGLKNCDGCTNRSSIMGGFGMDAAFNTAGPTRCDVEQVATIYCQLAGDPPEGGGGSICNAAEASSCAASGGTWDDNYCTCTYYNSCDPSGQQEWYCYSGGGVWDSYNCTCDYGGSDYCDPDGSQQQACEWSGGAWDSYNCNCGSTNSCALGVAELISETNYHYTAFGWPDNQDCVDTTRTYMECSGSCSNCWTYEEYSTYCCTPTNWGWCL